MSATDKKLTLNCEVGFTVLSLPSQVSVQVTVLSHIVLSCLCPSLPCPVRSLMCPALFLSSQVTALPISYLAPSLPMGAI